MKNLEKYKNDRQAAITKLDNAREAYYADDAAARKQLDLDRAVYDAALNDDLADNLAARELYYIACEVYDAKLDANREQMDIYYAKYVASIDAINAANNA